MANGDYNYNLSDFIVVMRNLVPAEKCKEMIDTCKDSQFWQFSTVGRNGAIDHSVRKVKELYVTDSRVKSSDPKLDKLDEDVFNYVLKAKNLYFKTLSDGRGMKHIPDIDGDEGYYFLHYPQGYFFKEHVDDYVGSNRTLTLTINLNEDYDGGLFRFLSGEFDVDLKTGDAVMFPSNFMFPHEVTEITRGERHSIVTWLQ